MANKRSFALLLVLLGLAIFCWKAQRWYESTLPQGAVFHLRAADNEIAGWHNGKKQWNVQAQRLTRTDEKTSFFNVDAGELYRQGESPLLFLTAIAEYYEKENLLKFPAGISFAADNRKLKVGKGFWDGNANVFEGNDVTFTDPGTTGSGAAEIAASTIRYNGAKKQWTFENNVRISWRDAAKGETYLLQTPVLIVDDKLTRSSLPLPITITGKAISGSAGSGLDEHKSLILDNISFRDENMAAGLTADKAIKSDKGWLFTGNVAIRKDNGNYWRPGLVEIDNNDNIILANITGVLKDVIFSADRLFSADRKQYQATGNILIKPRPDIQLKADSLTIAEEDEKYFFRKPRLQQDNGTAIASDSGLYDGKRNLLVFEKNVVTRRKDGREIQATKAVYNLENRVIEYTGEAQATRKAAERGSE